VTGATATKAAGVEGEVGAEALGLAVAGGGLSDTPAMMSPMSPRETRAPRRGPETELGESVGADVTDARSSNGAADAGWVGFTGGLVMRCGPSWWSAAP